MYAIQPVSTDSLATSVTPLRANFSILQTVIGVGTLASEHRISFVGEVKMWGGASTSIATSIPGWLHCDGSAVSRVTYADLYGVISTFYGVGDGANTFNLPSLTSVFVRGANTTPGGTGGNDSHTNTVGSLVAAMSGSTGTYDSGSGVQGTVGGGGPDYANHTHAVGTLAATLSGSTGAGDNIPKYGSVLYVIKF